jgi:tetrathionate reductase subunit A
VVYVLNRGGVSRAMPTPTKTTTGQQYNKMLGLYFENLVTTKNSMTGKPYLPYADFRAGSDGLCGEPH